MSPPAPDAGSEGLRIELASRIGDQPLLADPAQLDPLSRTPIAALADARRRGVPVDLDVRDARPVACLVHDSLGDLRKQGLDRLRTRATGRLGEARLDLSVDLVQDLRREAVAHTLPIGRHERDEEVHDGGAHALLIVCAAIAATHADERPDDGHEQPMAQPHAPEASLRLA